MAIKCSCCNNLINENDAQCNECGMSVILDTGGDEGFYANAVNDYKESTMSGTDICIVCYKYNINSDNSGQPEKVLKKLCSLKQYCPGKVEYINDEFNSPPLDRSISVELRFVNGEKSIPVNLEIGIDGNHIAKKLGIKFEDCFSARLVVNDLDYSGYSQNFKLINMDR